MLKSSQPDQKRSQEKKMFGYCQILRIGFGQVHFPVSYVCVVVSLKCLANY